MAQTVSDVYWIAVNVMHFFFIFALRDATHRCPSPIASHWNQATKDTSSPRSEALRAQKEKEKERLKSGYCCLCYRCSSCLCGPFLKFWRHCILPQYPISYYTQISVFKNPLGTGLDVTFESSNSFLDYCATILRMWSLVCGVLSASLLGIFYVNLVLKYMMTYYVVNLGLIVFLPWVLKVAVFILVRLYESNVRLMWWNMCDIYRLKAALYWRLLNGIFSLLFAFVNTTEDGYELGDVTFVQKWLQNMTVIGISWSIWYLAVVLFSNVWAVYVKRKYYRSTNPWTKILHIPLKWNSVLTVTANLYTLFLALGGAITLILGFRLGLSVLVMAGAVLLFSYIQLIFGGMSSARLFELFSGRNYNLFKILRARQEANRSLTHVSLELLELPKGYWTASEGKVKLKCCGHVFDEWRAQISHEYERSRASLGHQRDTEGSGQLASGLSEEHIEMVSPTELKPGEKEKNENDRHKKEPEKKKETETEMEMETGASTDMEKELENAIEKGMETTHVKPMETTTIEKRMETTIIEKPMETTTIEKGVETTTIEKAMETTTIEKAMETTTIESDDAEPNNTEPVISLAAVSAMAQTLRIESEDIYEQVFDDVNDYKELPTVTTPSHYLWKIAAAYDTFLFHSKVVDCWSTVIHYGVDLIVSLVLVIFVLLSMLGFVVLSSFSETSAGYRQSVYVNSAGDSVVPQYPICGMTYADTLTTVDLMFLTEVVYHFETVEIFDKQFDRYYSNNSVWHRIYYQLDEPIYYYLRHKTKPLDVMGIRGTKSFEDLMQDMSLFSEVVTMEVFSWILPLRTVLPKESLRDAVYYSSFSDILIDEKIRQRLYYSDILDKVESIAANDTQIENRTLIVLGHSLGGTLAQIIAAKLYDKATTGYKEVFAFGLNSPGLTYGSRKFGIEIEALSRTGISVYSRRDLISKIDTHEGMIETVECRRDYDLQCHVQSSIYCELYTSCVDLLGHDPLSDCFCFTGRDVLWMECL